MSDEAGRVLTLFLMFCIGAIGVIPYVGESSRWTRIVGGAWAVLWCSPAFSLLWIKGVFG